MNTVSIILLGIMIIEICILAILISRARKIIRECNNFDKIYREWIDKKMGSGENRK